MTDDDRVILQAKQVTTRRRYELLNVNEVDHMVRKLLCQLDEESWKQSGYVETGECMIEIHVRQVLKKR